MWSVESWFFIRLANVGAVKNYGIITAGITTFEDRRERCRKIILDSGCGVLPISRKSNGKETFAEFFVRFYGEPLTKNLPEGNP